MYIYIILYYIILIFFFSLKKKTNETQHIYTKIKQGILIGISTLWRVNHVWIVQYCYHNYRFHR